MRNYIIDEVINNLNYRDKDGRPNYTMVSGFLFHDEISYIQDKLNLDVKKLTTGYFLIVFKPNFNG